MNFVCLIGRLTKDPETRASADGKTVARYTLAVDRRGEGCDFIPCVCFGKSAEFAEKYLAKGMKIAVMGRIQTGSYTGKDGKKVYTTDIIVSEQEFCEKKGQTEKTTEEEFVSIPDGVNDEGLPFA